jgi:hypothetical protein
MRIKNKKDFWSGLLFAAFDFFKQFYHSHPDECDFKTS